MNNASRQRTDAAVERITFADLVSGVPANLFTKLPNGTIVTAIDTIIVAPFNSATSDLFDIGYAARGNDASPVAADGDAYKNDTNLAAAAGTKVGATLVPGLVSDLGGGIQITGTWTGVGAAPTQGEVLVIATLLEDGREHFTQG
jgi:hypothetical protein